MRYNVLIERLQNLTKDKANIKEIADIIGVPARTLYTRGQRNSNFALEEIIQIENYYNISLRQNDASYAAKIYPPDDIIKIPYWSGLPDELKIPDFTCVTAERNVIKNHWYLNPDSLCIVPMFGNKMANYWYKINDSDILIIDTSHNKIVGNGVYFATSQNNTRFWIREMQNLINNDVEFKAFSPSGNTTRVMTKQQLEEVDFKVIGKVVKNVSFRL